MTADELDAAVLGFVAERPGSSVWDLVCQFPQVPAGEPVPVPADGGLFAPPAPARLVPSVKPFQVVASLGRLRQDGRVTCTRDPGSGGAEHWHATDY